MLRLVSSLLVALLIAVSPAAGEEERASGMLTPQAIGELTLDELFAELPERAGSRAGKAVEAEILRRFHDSGSATADLLMSWALAATEEKGYAEALDLLDQVIMLKPDFAEAWNKRATVHYMLDDYASSLADIRQTLAIEPRHFGALSGFGMILEETGKEQQAVEVLRRALEINPQLDQVRESLERLEKATAGDSI